MNRLIPRFAFLLALFAGTLACNDPAEGKTAAKVEAPATPEIPAAPEGTQAREGPALPEGAIPFDQSAGTIAWVGSKVTGKHDGGFETFSGWVLRDPETETYRFKVTIDMSSVTSDTEKLIGHLKSGDFFLISEHPTATFETTEPVKVEGKQATITGNLSLRGVTRKITFPAEVKVREDGYSLHSEFTLKRFDWGIAYKGRADDLIRDEVVVKLDFESAL